MVLLIVSSRELGWGVEIVLHDHYFNYLFTFVFRVNETHYLKHNHVFLRINGHEIFRFNHAHNVLFSNGHETGGSHHAQNVLFSRNKINRHVFGRIYWAVLMGCY